jgi:hypothetical protein
MTHLSPDDLARQARAERLRAWGQTVWRLGRQLVHDSTQLPLRTIDRDALAVALRQAAHCRREAAALPPAQRGAPLREARAWLAHGRRIRRHLILGLPPE